MTYNLMYPCGCNSQMLPVNTKLEQSKDPLPRVVTSDRIAMFDCDDTLVLWDKHDIDLPTVNINGREFQVHTKHLQKIHDYYTMGYVVFVWSNSGYKWAQAVAEALQISDKVTCMSKPYRVFDDYGLTDIGSGYLNIEPSIKQKVSI